MDLIIALGLIFALFFNTRTCAASDGDGKAIIRQLRPTGVSIPYSGETNFDAATGAVFDSVYSCMWRRSAEILVCDKADGVLTWCDTSASFVSLPTDASSDTMQQIGNITLSRVGGYTYGSALITKLANQNTLLSIFTIGRSPDATEESYSDGTYERELMNEVGRHLYKASIGQAKGIAPAPPSKSNPAFPATNYASAFRGRFRNFLDCPTDSIKTNSQGTPYSVPADRLWAGILSVIAQYDVLIDIKPDQHKAVFAKRVSIPDLMHTNSMKRTDVLMVVLVEPGSQDSCVYHLAVLDEHTLLPSAMAGHGPQTKDNRISLLEKTPDFMKAAALVAGQLDQQIDMQMFYSERWGNKFLRRSGTVAPPHQ